MDDDAVVISMKYAFGWNRSNAPSTFDVPGVFFLLDRSIETDTENWKEINMIKITLNDGGSANWNRERRFFRPQNPSPEVGQGSDLR